MNKTIKNFFRHLWVGFNAMAYLSLALVLLYQYLAITYRLPGRFLTVLHDTRGDWWLDIQWGHPFVLVWLGCVFAFSAAYGFLRRHDSRKYREPGVESQSGF